MLPRLFLAAIAACGIFLLASPAVQAQGYGYGPPRHGGGQVLRCESRDSRTSFCAANTRRGVRLLDQHSRNACIEGRSWGWDGRGIWVSRGCRATFQVGGRDYGRPDYGRPGYGGRPDYYDPGHGGVFRCESVGGNYQSCRLPRGARGVEITRQFSRNACDFNYSWGYRGDFLWVDRGCRAEFRVY